MTTPQAAGPAPRAVVAGRRSGSGREDSRVVNLHGGGRVTLLRDAVGKPCFEFTTGVRRGFHGKNQIVRHCWKRLARFLIVQAGK